MAAGLTPQAKRGKNRRWLYTMETKLRELFPDAVVTRHGETSVTAVNAQDLAEKGYANSISVRLSWSNMSNGESFALPLINGN